MTETKKSFAISGRCLLVFAVAVLLTSSPDQFKLFSQSCSKEQIPIIFTFLESTRDPNSANAAQSDASGKEPAATGKDSGSSTLSEGPKADQSSADQSEQSGRAPATAGEKPEKAAGGALSSEADSASNGKALFEQKCASCHTIGGGKKVGPDLKGVTDTRSKSWLVSFIMDPEKMFNQGDHIATQLLKQYGGLKMPDLGVSQEQTNDILAYIEAESKAPSEKPKEQAEPAQEAQKPQKEKAAQPGSASRGRKLFVGDIALKNGGPPCHTCHNISGISFPYGGTLGPNLRGIYSRLGPAQLMNVLETIPYPTMIPIFGNRPLTEEERRDLAAFFEEADRSKPPPMTLMLAVPMAGGGFIAVMVVIWAYWRNRIRTVRREMVNKAART